MTEDCLFCKFAKGEIKPEIVFENEYTMAFLDINPAGKLCGHTIIIPKKHAETIDKLDGETLKETMLVVKSLVPAIMKACKAKGINLIQNNGKEAGQLIKHVHFHLIPRKFGDGIRLDENRRKTKPLELVETAREIKKALQNSNQ